MRYVVNCFRTCIFVILKTTEDLDIIYNKTLWIAFELVSSSYWKQRTRSTWHCDGVVNCFRTCIFVILKTTGFQKNSRNPMLWIAFELVSSSYWKQRSLNLIAQTGRCELLSNLYLRHIENNTEEEREKLWLLWIAFELVSSSYWKQQWSDQNRARNVVNCFRTCIFVILKTTSLEDKVRRVMLWIAFELVSSSYWKQQGGVKMTKFWSCELLSNLYLRHIENNVCVFE